MKIIVCIKQVPDTTDVKLDPKTNTLIREGIQSIVNPDDMAAIEEALCLKDEKGCEVTLLSMGPPQAQHALREGLAMGADKAVLLTSRVFGGADTWATSRTLAKAVEKLGGYDLLFCGRQAIDGDTAQVGPELAEHLGIPQVTYVREIKVEKDGTAIVKRAMETGYQLVKAKLPALLTFVKEANTPRLPTMGGIVRAYDDCAVEIWTEDDIGITPETVGLKGSPTQVKKAFPPPVKEAGQMMEGNTAQEMVTKLVNILADQGFSK